MVRPHGGRLVNRVLEKNPSEDELRGLERLDISSDLAKDLENIADGVFSPLEGFMSLEDLTSVVDGMSLSDDVPWTIPILLDVSTGAASTLEEGDDIVLANKSKELAILHLEEKYRFDNKRIAEGVFGTDNTDHPGVVKTLGLKDMFLSGRIDLISRPKKMFEEYHLTPRETRTLFKEKGWKTVVGFQTRNPPHIGHEYVQKTALTFVDGIFINPVIGHKKKGDFCDEVILRSYEELIKHYCLRNRTTMSILQTEMRYAGPREAIFHAIIRKNYGCTHFIVGRDHAGVGSYYGPFDAHEIFEEFPDLGITPVFFSSFFYCPRCGGVANEKTCPHEKDRVNYSGTDIRNMIINKKMPPENCMRPEIAKVIIGFEEPFVS